MNVNDIQLILFDYGGVIAPEGFQLGVLKLAHRFNKTFEEMYEIAGYSAGVESGYTAGMVDEKVYWELVGRRLGVSEDLTLCRDFFLDNFQPRKDMMDLISRLSQRTRIGVFSDQTNWIYELDEKYGFLKYFEYLCISFEKGYTKHDPEFYRIPSRETGIEPSRILVVDDKQRVIDAVRAHGMNGYKFVYTDDCVKYLSSFLD